MALIINTNVTSLFAQQYLTQNQAALNQTLTRLSSGLRVNNASDDPAGLAIAETMQSNINGLNIGARNGQDGISLLQTAQGAMQQVLNDLQTMNQLATQSANGVYSSQDRTDLNDEYQQLLDEVGRLTATINFNGINVLGGGSLAIQIGYSNTSNDVISITLTDTSTGSTGLNIDGSTITDITNATNAMGSLALAINSLTSGLATIGADEANLQAAIANNTDFANNLTAAESAIMDADMAAESANLAKYNVLNQTNVAMLAQANSAPQLVLQLLQG